MNACGSGGFSFAEFWCSLVHCELWWILVDSDGIWLVRVVSNSFWLTLWIHCNGSVVLGSSGFW